MICRSAGLVEGALFVAFEGWDHRRSGRARHGLVDWLTVNAPKARRTASVSAGASTWPASARCSLPGGAQYSVVVIVPERGGKDFAPYYVDIAEDPFMATVYRTGRSRVGRVFGRMQIFGTIRAAVCGRMAWLGLELDRAANCANGPLISTRASKVRGTG
jgi:hypothetical protein